MSLELKDYPPLHTWIKWADQNHTQMNGFTNIIMGWMWTSESVFPFVYQFKVGESQGGLTFILAN